MQTLYDLGLEVQKIREAVDDLEIKGMKNASRIVYVVTTCNNIIQFINDVCEQQQNPPEEGQNGVDTLHVELETDEMILEEEGDTDGEPDSGTSS